MQYSPTVCTIAAFVCLYSMSACEAPKTSPNSAAAPDALGGAVSARRIVAVGDLHGDLEATRAALSLAGVLGAEDAWVGGQTILVQTGDVLDRGSDEQAILDLLDALA
ncbi:MAG: metallophosphoesterase, partial [Myxococcota bacterium]